LPLSRHKKRERVAKASADSRQITFTNYEYHSINDIFLVLTQNLFAMSIKFKVIEKAQPGVAGGGVKKHYATTVRADEVSLDRITSSIEKISTVSGADIRAVLYALVDVSVDYLSNGHIVRLGDLGSLMLNVKSEGRDTPEEVTAAAIKGTNVVFTPGSRIKTMQSSLKYQKA